MTSPLKVAIDKIGLAGIGNLYDPPITAQAVHKWLDDGVPFGRCFAIEQATNGLVTRKMLRPDDWQTMWPELAEAA